MSEQKPSSKQELSRRDFLKVAGVAAVAGATAGLGVQPEVQGRIGKAASGATRSLNKNLREYSSPYRKLAEGEAAVGLLEYEEQAGINTWKTLLEMPPENGRYNVRQVEFKEIEEGSTVVVFKPDIPVWVPFTRANQEITFEYDNSGSEPVIWAQISGKRYRISQHELINLYEDRGEITKEKKFQFLNENGKLEFESDGLLPEECVTAVQFLTEKGYSSISTVVSVRTLDLPNKGPQIWEIEFPEVGIDETIFARVFKAQKEGETRFFSVEPTRTGFRYLLKNGGVPVKPHPKTK